MPTALHGMIWMTRAFFMLAGRLPVLMFSFMIRTLVSFCNQGRGLEDDGPEAGEPAQKFVSVSRGCLDTGRLSDPTCSLHC